MEAIVLSKRRKALEDELSIDKYQYDLWFDYANLEEQANTIDINKVREIYYDKKNNKAIYGTATNKEREELAEEGIDLMSIPWVGKEN